MSLPNTFIIGVQKAGTTSLHNWLSQHPDIYAPQEFKDTDYFVNPNRTHEIVKRFNKDYAGYSDEAIILQTYVNYILYSHSLSLIKEFTPQAKVIVVLRKPEDRAISAYKYFIKMGREDRKPKEALIYKPKNELYYSQDNNDFTYLEHGLYGTQLENVFKIFDSKDILILQFEELLESPIKITKKVFKFLGVDSSFSPIFYKKNQTGTIKSQWLQNQLMGSNSLKRAFIKLFVDWWLPSRKRQLVKKRIIEMNTSNKEEDLIPSEVKKWLKEFYEKDQLKLKELLKSHGKK